MGKYSALYDDIYSVFSDSAWVVENILTVPSNFVGTSAVVPYIRVSIVPSGKQIANHLKSVSGLCMIDIFIPAGEGEKPATLIADKLDTYLAGKTKETTASGNTQFDSSSLTHLGTDKANPSLHRSIYQIPFNFFGK